jgi:hypothetical protein
MIKLSSIAICELMRNVPERQNASSISRTWTHAPTALNFYWYIFRTPRSGQTEELVGYHNGQHIFTLVKYVSRWEVDFCDPYVTKWYPLLTQLTKKTILTNLLG